MIPTVLTLAQMINVVARRAQFEILEYSRLMTILSGDDLVKDIGAQIDVQGKRYNVRTNDITEFFLRCMSTTRVDQRFRRYKSEAEDKPHSPSTRSLRVASFLAAARGKQVRETRSD